MAVPTASNFPSSFDSDDNLFLVHDSLRVRLTEDYTPGDTSILVEGDPSIIDKFPPTGIITCTEQCSDLEDRAISFYYTSKTDSSFDGLFLLPEFTDVSKPKGVTNVTQNVMAKHHNHLKDALIAIQTFVGIEGQTDLNPLGETLEGRINFLRKLILTPRAWFTMDTRVGLVPLCVTFTDQSFRLGDGEIIYIWDFGDASGDTISICSTISQISCIISQTAISHTKTISVISTVPSGSENVLVRDLDGGSIKKCYNEPGLYTVILSVINEFGTDVVQFDEIINARIESPDLAVVDFIPRTSQDFTPGTPTGGPYTTTPPKIRSRANTFIDLSVTAEENLATPNISYSGEALDGSGNPLDPVVEYTWSLGDDLTHGNTLTTRASYSVGGNYDMEMRVDTQFGAYRITSYEDAIDIVESSNLWMHVFQSQDATDGGVVQAYEFGLISETFKTLGNTTLTINRSNRHISYPTPTYHTDADTRGKSEFSRNAFITPQGTISSGNSGESLIFWARGYDGSGPEVDSELIEVRSFNAFADTYTTKNDIEDRPWNWTALVSDETAYFMLGSQWGTTPSGTNSAKDTRTEYDLATSTHPVPTNLTAGFFENGADELLTHPSSFDSGIATNGYFAVYRSAWKDQIGYLLRNSAVNEFYRLADFYRTEGSLIDPFLTITKLPDIAGAAKLEGQLVAMANGIFFFNNSGEIAAWNDLSATWEVGRTSSAAISFRSLQDTNVSSFDDKKNTLLATSDKDRIAYLSYDYSTNAFIKFNGTDQTFVSAGIRPAGRQFTMGIY